MSSPTLRLWAPGIIALLCLVVFWAGREVMVLDVGIRLLLPALWLVIWTSACFAVGAALVWTANRRRPKDQPELVVVLATGSVGLSALATALAAAHLLRPWSLVTVLAASAAAGLWLVIRRRFMITLPQISVDFASAALVIGSWAALYFVLTSPPVMFDVLHYHLAFPDRWLQAGAFTTFDRHGFSFYPYGHGMAYSYALASFGPWAASALHWWFGAVAALCAASLGARLGGPKVGWWALALFALTPATLEVAGFAISDLTVACWTGAAFVALLGKADSRTLVSRWALAGLLIGGAFTAKYLALATAVAPFGAAAVVSGWRQRGPQFWKAWAALAVCATLVASPWLIRNTILTGNPVYPYFRAALGGPASGMNLGVELAQNDHSDAGGFRSALRTVVALPHRTFSPLRQGGYLGLAWIILLPGALLLRRVRADRWAPLAAATITGIIAWGALVQFARFLLPVLVPAAALAGATAAALTTLSGPAMRRMFHGLLLVLLAWNSTVLATRLNYQRLGVATGFLSETDFLATWVSYQPALDFINQNLPQDAVILLIGEPRSLYIDRVVLVEDSYRRPWLLDLAVDSRDVDDLFARVLQLGATHLLVNEGHMDWAAHLRAAGSYWDGAPPDARQRVDELLRDFVEQLYSDKGVWVGRLKVTGRPDGDSLLDGEQTAIQQGIDSQTVIHR